MGNLFNILSNAHTNDIVTGDVCDTSSNTFFIFQIAYTVVLVIQIAVPFVLIVLGSIDFFKSVVAGDEKEMKQKRKPFVQRLIAAVVIFLLPFLINLIIKTFFSKSQFGDCWNKAVKNRTIKIPDAEDITGSGSTVTPSGQDNQGN